jgi:hypothetical protein
MQSQEQQRGTNFWKPAAIGSLFLALINVYDPARDVIQLFVVQDADKVASQRVKDWQDRLRERNLACFLDMSQIRSKVNDQLEIAYGVCPNKNVHIAVYPSESSAYEYWLEPNEKVGVAQVSGLMSSSAYAAPAAQPVPGLKGANSDALIRAQTVLKTVCQGWNNAQKTLLDRITNEGGQCYYERVSTQTGIIEVRERIGCEMQCDAAGKQFNAVKRYQR